MPATIEKLEQDLASERSGAEGILATIKREQRTDPTADERQALEHHITRGKTLQAQIAQQRRGDEFTSEIDRLLGGNGQGTALERTAGAARHLSLGAQFTASATYRAIAQMRGSRPQSFTTPASELFAATLTEDPASGGGVIVPQYVPGITPLPTPPIVMSRLFPSKPLSSNLAVFMQEKLIVNAAAPVAEGAVKPESTLTFERKEEPARKIATWLPVTEEILEDEPAMRGYIDARLAQFVRLEEEDQLLNGSGVAPELNGLLVRTDLAPPMAVGAANSLETIAKQIGAVTASSGLEVDGIVLHPTDYLTMLLTKDSTGQYLGGSPFDGFGGNTLWKRPVATTTKMPLGTALVGNFALSGILWRRGGIRVEASNSHADFFIRNLLAIRAETRLALALIRPWALGKVTGLNPPA